MEFGRRAQNYAIIAAVACNIMLLMAIGWFYPPFVVDGGVLQTATAILYLLTALLAAFMAARPAGLRPRIERLAMAFVAFFALIFFLSEISFGALYFDISMPPMKGGGEFDGAHDVVILSVRYFASLSGMGKMIVTGVAMALAAVAAMVAIRHWRLLSRLWSRILASLIYFLFLVTFCLLAIAVTLDVFDGWAITLLEESAEAIASIAMLSAVVLAYRASTARQRAVERALRRQTGLG